MVKHTRCMTWVAQYLWYRHELGIRFVTTREIEDQMRIRYPRVAPTSRELVQALRVFRSIGIRQGPRAWIWYPYEERYLECATWFNRKWRPSK